jgi:hypothetical protein
MSILVLSFLAQISLSEWKAEQCRGEIVTDRYVNYAEGFSVAMPTGLQGRRGEASGPERGVSIPLSSDCVGVVVVFGEPNGALWKTPAAAVAETVNMDTKANGPAAVRHYRTRLGHLAAAGAIVRHNGRSDVADIVIAFRPGGEPVYIARLATTQARYKRDHGRFVDVLRSFRLEDWR